MLPSAFPPDVPPAGAAPFAPAARRRIELFGAPAELVLVPHRARRHGSGTGGGAFGPSPASRILATEAVARAGGLVLTPNLYPFAQDHWLLWSEAPVREASPALLEALFATAERWRGTALVNSIGAAATIPHAHGHLTTERLPFLDELAEEPCALEGIELPSSVEVVRKARPMPLLVGLRGEAADRARAVHELQLCRRTAAFNLVAGNGVTWLWPRSPVEIPAPWFPYRLGAAELWGRFCFADRESFEAATAGALERALVACGLPG